MKKLELVKFEKKIKTRQLRKTDYDAVVNLQVKCFPEMKPWTFEQFTNLLNIFPEGQLCVEFNKKVIASSSSLILSWDEYSDLLTWRDLTAGGNITNHDPLGDTLYGIEIMVAPEYRGMKLARRLYEARKLLVKKKNLKRIAIGGRIPNYHKYQKRLSAREYVEKVTDRVIHDPILTTQLANGFALKKLLPGYLPSDKQSCGYATSLEWVNLDYNPQKNKSLYPASRYVRVCCVQYQMRTIKSFDEFAAQSQYFIDIASDYRCDFVIFPEMFTTQLLSLFKNLRPAIAMRRLSGFTKQYLEVFTSLAIKFNINIIGGSHFSIEEGNLYNISYLFKRDGTIGKQYKLHITPSEKKWWGVKPGNRVEVFDTDKGKISILICYDIEFPELARIVAEKGARIIFVPFNTDERRAYLRVRYCAHARCIENQVYTVITGCVGNLPAVENLDVHYAQSAILTPSDIPFSRDGVAAECSPNIETIIFQDLDLKLINQARETGSVLTYADRRRDVYRLSYTEDNLIKDA